MTEIHDAHPKNAPGDFYVVGGCCTLCGVPDALAPTLFASDDQHCYVRHQPSSPVEMESALRVIHTQELGCIRYRGTDPVILQRLADAAETDQCDLALPEGMRPQLRNHVTFIATTPEVRRWSSKALLEDFAAHFINKRKPFLAVLPSVPLQLSVRATPIIEETAGLARFSISWFDDQFHTVVARALFEPSRDWLLTHSFGVGLSESLDDWLRERTVFDGIRWYTEEQWPTRRAWQTRPW